jgi:hypothetical protein
MFHAVTASSAIYCHIYIYIYETAAKLRIILYLEDGNFSVFQNVSGLSNCYSYIGIS